MTHKGTTLNLKFFRSDTEAKGPWNIIILFHLYFGITNVQLHQQNYGY